MNIKYKKVNNMKELKASINDALTSANTMKKKVQIAAAACVYMASKVNKKETQDLIDMVNDMVVDLGDGIRSKGLIAFFSKFGFVLAEDVKEGFSKLRDKKYIEDNYQMARATFWWELSPEAAFKDYDFKDALRKLIKTAKAKATDEEHADNITIDMDMLEVVKQLLEPNGKVKADGAMALVQRLAA